MHLFTIAGAPGSRGRLFSLYYGQSPSNAPESATRGQFNILRARNRVRMRT